MCVSYWHRSRRGIRLMLVLQRVLESYLALFPYFVVKDRLVVDW
jgi:hypothetical protein